MNIDLLEVAVARLGDLASEFVFVGGATIELWITDTAAPEFRPTNDVDAIVEVSGRLAYREVERRLEELGLRHDQESAVICRFRDANTGLILDVMPTDASILGFANEWHGPAFANAVSRSLPSGASIDVVPPPYLLATKLEAFKGRGKGDLLGSRDFADIVALIDGREELLLEVAAAPPDVHDYIKAELGQLREMPLFVDGVAGHLMPDPSSQERSAQIVLPRIADLLT